MCGSKAWCLRENEKATLRKMERVMMRPIISHNVTDKATEEQMDMLGLKKIVDMLAQANGIGQYKHKMKKGGDSVLKVALNLEVERESKASQNTPGRSKRRKRKLV